MGSGMLRKTASIVESHREAYLRTSHTTASKAEINITGFVRDLTRQCLGKGIQRLNVSHISSLPSLFQRIAGMEEAVILKHNVSLERWSGSINGIAML